MSNFLFSGGAPAPRGAGWQAFEHDEDQMSRPSARHFEPLSVSHRQ